MSQQIIIMNIHWLGNLDAIEEFCKNLISSSKKISNFKFIHQMKTLEFDVNSSQSAKYIQKKFIERFGVSASMIYKTSRTQRYIFETTS